MKYYFFIFLFFTFYKGNSQVKFENLTLKDAFIRANKEGKMVFVQNESTDLIHSSDLANSAFEKKELGDFMNQKCISIKVNPEANGGIDFINSYNPLEINGFFYFTSEGDLLHTVFKSSNRLDFYKEETLKAENKFIEGRLPLKELDKMWFNSKNDISIMEYNLLRRQELKMPIDSLLDIYTSILHPDSFNSLRVIQFIQKKSPILDGYTSLRIREDYNLFNRAWYAMSSNERSVINGNIITKSRNKAIRNKNLSLAIKVANFSKSLYGKDSVNGKKYFDLNMMLYYEGISDTTNSFSSIIHLINENYPRSISIRDSLRRIDSLNYAESMKIVRFDTIKTATGIKINKHIGNNRLMITSAYTNWIKMGARYICNNSNDINLLKQALEFSDWTCLTDTELSLPYTYCINACLFYKLNKKEEAMKKITKAIEMINKHSPEAPSLFRYKDVLNKMLNNEIYIKCF